MGVSGDGGVRASGVLGGGTGFGDDDGDGQGIISV
jgi:hypothetical protein